MNLVDDGQSGAQTPNSAQASWLRGAGAQGLRHRHSFDQNNHRELYNWEDMQGCGELGRAIASDDRMRSALDAIDFVRPFVKNMPDIANMIPAIVVVGDQSSGKSSLLEILSGVVLPRGEGICTRVPLELQLRQANEWSAYIEYQINGDGPRRCQRIGVEEVKDAILIATKCIAGNDLNVKDSPIVLRMAGPAYQDLTLIDLPGIARVPLRGQPRNIEELTMEMISRYITGDSKVILCAIPANTDFVTSAAVKLASSVDPQGLRTLGVVTKIDQSTGSIKRKLEGLDGSDVSLKLGFVAVRCRTQKEADDGLSLQDVRKREELLFESDPELQEVHPGCRGINTLVQKLVDIQKDRLIHQLPRIVRQLDERISDIESSCVDFDQLVESEHQATARTHACIRDLCEAFNLLASCEKLESDTSLDIPAETFSMIEDFVHEVRKVTSGILNPAMFEEIRALTERFRGNHLPNFLPHPVYRQIFQTRILDALKPPVDNLVKDVLAYIDEVIHKLIERQLRGRFPKLVGLFCEQASLYLQRQYESTKFLVEETVEAQSEFMTFTPSYMEIMDAFHMLMAQQTAPNGKQEKLPQLPKGFSLFFQDRSDHAWFVQQMVESKSDQFSKGCLEMLFALAAYATTVRTVLTEDIPKIVRRSFVTKVGSREKGLENFLLEKLTNGNVGLFDLMHDTEKIADRKQYEYKYRCLLSYQLPLASRMTLRKKLESMKAARDRLQGIAGRNPYQMRLERKAETAFSDE